MLACLSTALLEWSVQQQLRLEMLASSCLETSHAAPSPPACISCESYLDDIVMMVAVFLQPLVQDRNLWAVSGWKCHASGNEKLQQQLLQWRRPESHTPGIKSQHMHTFTQRHGWMHGTCQSSNTDVQNFDWFISIQWLPKTRNTLQQPSSHVMGQESKKWGSGDVRNHHITWTFATNSRKMLSLGILCNQLRWYRGLNNEARFSRLETTPAVVRFKHALGPSYTYTHTIHTRISVEQCVNNSS